MRKRGDSTARNGAPPKKRGPSSSSGVAVLNSRHIQCNKDIDLLKKENKYVGLGIANAKDTFGPNSIIKFIAGKKQKSSGAVILLDPDFTFGNLVGAPHTIATSILVDKNRIVRYVYSGKTPTENIPKIIDLIKKYAAE